MKVSNKVKGTICGVLAAMTYGTNALFSKNLINMGVDVDSILLYRYAIATVVMAAIMIGKGRRLRMERRQTVAAIVGGGVFALSSVALYMSFLYMDAGVACSILFVYPIIVAVCMALFFGERASALTFGCLAMALCGIAMLYKGENGASLSATGLALVLLSSASYAAYILGVNRSSLSKASTGKSTFWVLVGGTLFFLALTRGGTALHEPLPTWRFWVNALCIGVVPTIIPILFTNYAIKTIGPTYCAIMGALEPVTAMVIGTAVFGELITVRIACGALLILTAVTIIVARPLLRSFVKKLTLRGSSRFVS